MGTIFCDETAINNMALIKMAFIQVSEDSSPRPVYSMIVLANTSVTPERDIATAKAPSSP